MYKSMFRPEVIIRDELCFFRPCAKLPSLPRTFNSIQFNSIQFNSIQFYLYSAITIQLSLGALQSPEPETPLVQAQWQHGKKKLPVSQEGTLSRTTAHKGGLICLRSAGRR